MLDRLSAPASSEILFERFPQGTTRSTQSGIPLHILSAGQQPVIKLEIRLASGIWYESQAALSWLCAKMLAEGTKSKDAKTLMEAFELLGAFLEIDPGFDHVSIVVHCMSRNFDQVLELLSEMLSSPGFRPEDFEHLKKIRIDQLKLNDAKNNMYASKMVRQAVFGADMPYGRILEADQIEKITLSQIQDFYKNQLFNQPEIFISGDVHESELTLISQLNVPKSDCPERPDQFELKPQKEVIVERRDSLQSSIRMAWTCPQKNHPDYHNFSLTNSILGGYFGSRLMASIREEKGYTYGISSYPIHLRHRSFSIIGTDVKAEFTQATVDAIHEEILKLQTEGASQEELKSVTNYLAGKFQSSLGTPFKLMDKYKQLLDSGLDYDYYSGYFDAMKDFDGDQLMESAKKFFDPENSHLVIVGRKD